MLRSSDQHTKTTQHQKNDPMQIKAVHQKGPAMEIRSVLGSDDEGLRESDEISFSTRSFKTGITFLIS
jgi:hypothetical protein